MRFFNKVDNKILKYPTTAGAGSGRQGPGSGGRGRGDQHHGTGPGGNGPGGPGGLGGPAGPSRTLKVTTAPTLWGVEGSSHTKETCNPIWMNKLSQLYKNVSSRFADGFQWLDETGEIRGGADQADSEMYEITQFMAMIVVKCLSYVLVPLLLAGCLLLEGLSS